MNEHIKKYLYLLSKEVKSKINNDFNLGRPIFEGFQIFDFVNFLLIYNYILNDSPNKKDLFIGISEEDVRPSFFPSILHSLSLIKLYQNFMNFEKENFNLNVGDLVCAKYKGELRTLEVKNNIDGQVFFNCKFLKNNELGLNNFTLKSNIRTKLNPNAVRNKNTIKIVQNYRDYLDKYFDAKFPLITEFQNKALVITEKSFFDETFKDNKFLPIQYINNNGKIKNKLPFFDFMIDGFNRVDSIITYLKASLEKYDEIIVIEYVKYRDSFSDILQNLKWQGKVKNIILIGSQKPNSENDFIEWHWGKDEIRFANKEQTQHPTKQVIENHVLHEKLIELKNEIDKLKTEKNVNVSFLLKYTNFYFRLILKKSPVSKGVYAEYCERLLSYFKSEKFEEELNNLFYNQDIYSPETIKENTDKIFKNFQKIATIISTNNLKWNYITEKVNELGRKSLYLIVEKKSYPNLLQQLKNEKISNIKLIPDKKIDNQIDCLQSWLNSNDKNIADRQYIVPYLNNMEMFDKLSQLKGNCEVLCYKDIDEIAFDNLVCQFNADEKKRLTHSDRKHFVQVEFSEDEQYLQRQLDDLFKFDLSIQTFHNNPYESIDLPREKVLYEIEFEDGVTDKFESSKGIFLIDGTEQITTTIGEVFEGATIRFYQNNNPAIFRKILKIFDMENKLDLFDAYSNSWKQTLKKLLDKFDSMPVLYAKLFDGNHKINFNTFQFYFHENTVTRFPRRKTLEAIKKLCLKMGLCEELIVTEFDKFLLYSKKDHSIRQQAGRILGNDLIDYEASNKTEKSEALMKLSDTILNNLLQTVQTKVIKKKILLEEEI
jgi:hypothetical protein